MADLKLQYKDALIDVNAGFGGLHHITVTCRNYTQVFDPDELQDFMALLYPSVDAKAKEFDAPPTTPAP